MLNNFAYIFYLHYITISCIVCNKCRVHLHTTVTDHVVMMNILEMENM